MRHFRYACKLGVNVIKKFLIVQLCYDEIKYFIWLLLVT